VRLHVPVSLRGADGSRQFLSEIEIVIANGRVQPLELAGRRYTFLHTVGSNAFGSSAHGAEHETIYVFSEQDYF
jgi:hypothetical protein